jgi:hypothetical protein
LRGRRLLVAFHWNFVCNFGAALTRLEQTLFSDFV